MMTNPEPKHFELEVGSSLIESISFSKDVCVAPLCKLPLAMGDHIMIDRLSTSVYCHKCGVNLRFHRKRAIARGEDPPVTFTDVEARFIQ